MAIIRLTLTVLARFFISLVFLAGALNKILHWHETERFLLQILSEWQTYVGFSDFFHDFFSFLIPLTPLVLLVATVFEFVGGLSILLGIKDKVGALLLILFLVPTTVIMHQFWFVEGSARELQLVHFLKNLAILGALLLILLNGTSLPKPKNPFTKFQ